MDTTIKSFQNNKKNEVQSLLYQQASFLQKCRTLLAVAKPLPKGLFLCTIKIIGLCYYELRSGRFRTTISHNLPNSYVINKSFLVNIDQQ